MPGAPPVLHRPPMTVWLMALTTAWNPEYWYVNWFIVSLLLSVACLFVTRRIAMTLGLHPVARNLLLLAVALHPMLIASVRATSFLQPGMLMLLFTIAVALSLKRDFRWWRAALLGVGLAGAALTHGTLILLVLIVPLWLLFQPEVRWRAVVSIVIALVCIAPWTYRNYIVSQRFVPVVNGAGTQFWIARGVAADDPLLHHRVYAQQTGDTLTTEYFSSVNPGADAALTRAAFNHWTDYIEQYVIGLYHFWVPTKPSFKLKFWLDIILVLPIAVVWLILAFSRLRDCPPSLMTWVTLVLWLTFAVFFPSTSYYLLVLPLMLISITWQLDRRLNP